MSGNNNNNSISPLNTDYASIVQRTASPSLEHPQQLGLCLVTGAAGFLGRNLVDTLLAQGVRVRALTHRTPLDRQHAHLTCMNGDITDRSAMLAACENVDTVFHTAAKISLMGGRFASRSYREDAWQANVVGTQTLLDAAKQQGCQRLIDTSSIDVCFSGQESKNMDESMPYIEHHTCVYGTTKIEAEKRVLAANDPAELRTCAIRPAGIYGAGKNVMIDTFLEQLQAGMLVMRMGNRDAKQDTSQVDNLVHAEILAAMHLVTGGVACGQAYFISDNAVMNLFEFFRPIIEGLGYKVPHYSIPGAVLRPVLRLWQALHFTAHFPEPMLSPHELDKVVVSHWGSTARAKRDLGYEPVKSYQQAISECLQYCREAIRQ